MHLCQNLLAVMGCLFLGIREKRGGVESDSCRNALAPGPAAETDSESFEHLKASDQGAGGLQSLQRGVLLS